MANRPRPHTLTARCLQLVLDSPDPVRPCDVARRLKIPSNAVRMVLIRLADRGAIEAHPVSPTRTDYRAPHETVWRIWDRIIRNIHQAK